MKTAEVGYPDDAPVPIWGFEITRTDNSKIWLHPNAQNNKKAKKQILCRLDADALSQAPLHPGDRGKGKTKAWDDWTDRNWPWKIEMKNQGPGKGNEPGNGKGRKGGGKGRGNGKGPDRSDHGDGKAAPVPSPSGKAPPGGTGTAAPAKAASAPPPPPPSRLPTGPLSPPPLAPPNKAVEAKCPTALASTGQPRPTKPP